MMNSLRLFTAATVACGAIFLSVPCIAQTAVSSDTAFYQGDSGHSGYVHTTTPAVLSVAWQHTLPDVKTAYSTPALSNGVLYVGAGAHVYALNESDGTIKWQYPADGSAATGQFNCPPAVADGKVFIGSENNNLSVFDANTGALLWQVPTTGTVESAPVVSNGNVFFGSSDGYLYGISEATQQPVWGGEFRSGGPIFSAPAEGDGLIFFADSSSDLYGVRENSGVGLWTYLPTGGISPGSPVYRGDLVYFASGSNIFGLTTRTGSVRTSFSVPGTIVGPPTVSDQNIFVTTSDQEVYCFTLHGSMQWHTHLYDIVSLATQITDSYLFATSRSGVIYALDPQSGQIIWSYSLLKAVSTSTDKSSTSRTNLPRAQTDAAPLVADGKLFILTDDGTVTAFSGNAPDNIAPVVLSVNPKPDSTVAGSSIPFRVFVNDSGSGINPSSVSLTIGGWSAPIFYNPSYSEVSVAYEKQSGNVGLSRVQLPTLPDGVQTATLKIADWRGNVVTKTWSFTVDNTLDPAGSLPPTPLSADSSVPTDNNTSENMTIGQGPTSQPGGVVQAGGPPTNGAGNNAGGQTGVGAGTSSPLPSAPPPSAGGGKFGFPPPPPI